MDEFGYLSVLISIVLGFALANLLTGMAALVRARANTKIYWPALMWMALVFVVTVQSWWQMFTLRVVQRWHFGAFLVVMMQPVLLFLMSAIIVPNVVDGSAVDLRARFYRERRWFFGVQIGYVCVSASKDIVLYGHVPRGMTLAGHTAYFTLALCAFSIRNENFQKAVVIIALAIDACYVGSLLLTLA
ncbi:MAG TPA: hypothetical protein VMD53_00525 [Rhizomicrobium sp.]|nr:hypothetical protein [Rhizomicrobium sp.]